MGPQNLYHLWLGISPDEQPPDFYRLLALRRYEPSFEVISSAADQRSRQVQAMLQTAPSVDGQKLLAEVTQATQTLLDPAQKQRYDDYLRACEAHYARQAAMTQQPPAVPITTQPLVHSPAPTPQPTTVSVQLPKRAAGNERTIVVLFTLTIASILIAMVSVYGFLYLSIERHTKPQPQVVLETKESPAPLPLQRPNEVAPAQRPVPSVPRSKPMSDEPMAEPEDSPELFNEVVRPTPVPIEIPTPSRPSPMPPKDLKSLPDAVELPSTLSQAETVLFTAADFSEPLEFQVRSEAADIPAPAMFFAERDTNSQHQAWNLMYAADPIEKKGEVVPVAKLQMVDGECRFQWASTTTESAIAKQLCNCFLQAKLGSQYHSIQMRKVETAAAPALNYDEKDTLVVFEIPNAPRTPSLFLEVKPLSDGTFRNANAEGTFGKPVVVQFAGLEGAELSIKLQRKGSTGQIGVRVTPEFDEGSRSNMEMTRDKLADMTKLWQEQGKKATIELNQALAKITTGEKQLQQLSGISGNGSVMAERDRSMQGIQADLKRARDRVSLQRKKIAEAGARPKAAPAVLKFMDAHHQKEKIRFQVYAKAGNDRLILVDAAN